MGIHVRSSLYKGNTFNENFNFFTVLCNGSTDSTIIEKELICVIYVDPETFGPTCSFFAIKQPISQVANGIDRGIPGG